jgi:hypothetical protein
MKLLGILLLLTGLTVTLLLRFSPAMGSDAKSTLKEVGNEGVVPVRWEPALGSLLIVSGVAVVIIGRKRRG